MIVLHALYVSPTTKTYLYMYLQIHVKSRYKAHEMLIKGFSIDYLSIFITY